MAYQDLINIQNEALLDNAIAKLKKPASYLRINDRDPKSGYYSYTLPDGTVLLNGEKIYNASHQSGDLISGDGIGNQVTPLDDKSAIADTGYYALATENKPGYINGQIFTIPDKKPELRVNIKYVYTLDDLTNNQKVYYIGGFQQQSIEVYRHALYDVIIPTISGMSLLLNSDRQFSTKILDNYGNNDYRLSLITDKIIIVEKAKEVFAKTFTEITKLPPVVSNNGFTGNTFIPLQGVFNIDPGFEFSNNRNIWINQKLEAKVTSKYINLPAKEIAFPHLPGDIATGVGRNWYMTGRINRSGNAALGIAIKQDGTSTTLWHSENGKLTEVSTDFLPIGYWIDCIKSGFTAIKKPEFFSEPPLFNGTTTDKDVILFVDFYDANYQLKSTKKIRVFKPSVRGDNFVLLDLAYLSNI